MIKIALKVLVSAMLFIIAGVGSVSADTTFINVSLIPTGTLTGTATLMGGGGHGGIFVYVSGTSIVGTTNQSGNYTIIGVPYGTYTLTFTKAGYTNQNRTGLIISSAGQVVNVSGVSLVPNSETEAKLFGDALRLYSYDRYSESIAALRGLIAANPTGKYAAASQYRVALAFGSEDKYDSAIAALASLITTYSSDSLVPHAYYWRGSYKDAKLNYSGALADFQQVVTSYSSYPVAGRAQYRVGRSQEELGNVSAAINAYLAVETNYPSSPDIKAAIVNSGWLYYTSDQYPRR